MKKVLTKKEPPQNEHYGCDVHPYLGGKPCRHGRYVCVECCSIHGNKCSICSNINKQKNVF